MPIPQDYLSSVEQSSYTDETMNGDEYEYYDEGTTQPYKKQITQSHHHWQSFFPPTDLFFLFSHNLNLHCSKSNFFVQKFNFDFPQKIVDFFGEKLVKMLWFWAF